MVSDVIERIRDAERTADDDARAARSRAREIVAAAHEASERMLEEMRRKVREDGEALLETARDEASREAESLVAEGRASIEAVRDAGEKGIGAGVKRVLESITAAAK